MELFSTSKQEWYQRLALRVLVFAAVALAAPILIYPILLMKLMCFALFAMAFNLLAGFGGLMSFGHAAFFGAASYTTAYIVKETGVPPELGILAGVLVATSLGAFFGWMAVRRSGIYFAMITLALAQIVYFICLQSNFTGGEDGIQAVPRGIAFGFVDLSSDTVMYCFVLSIFTVGIFCIHRIVNSPFGHVLKAIRENEARATSLGYRADRYIWVTFILSAALSGLAGSTKALVFQLASLTDVHWQTSSEVVLMTLLGGLGTVYGPAFGALLVVGMQSYLAGIGPWLTIVQGFVFVFCVLAFPGGVLRLFNAQANKKAVAA